MIPGPTHSPQPAPLLGGVKPGRKKNQPSSTAWFSAGFRLGGRGMAKNEENGDFPGKHGVLGRFAGSDWSNLGYHRKNPGYDSSGDSLVWNNPGYDSSGDSLVWSNPGYDASGDSLIWSGLGLVSWPPGAGGAGEIRGCAGRAGRAHKWAAVQKMWARVRAVGADNHPGPWSDPATKTVP